MRHGHCRPIRKKEVTCIKKAINIRSTVLSPIREEKDIQSR